MNREVKLLPTEQSILNCSTPLGKWAWQLPSPAGHWRLKSFRSNEVVEQEGNMETGGDSGQFLKLLLAF